MWPYHSLTGLPGTTRDEFGNLEIIGHEGMRARLEFAMRLPLEALKNRQLGELLDWLRWGSPVSVMWEGHVDEIQAIIERWEEANPGAGPELYYGSPEIYSTTWEGLWKKSYRESIRQARKCCGKLVSAYDHCPSCDKPWFELEWVEVGPRGELTHNTVLVGAGGLNVAVAAYNSRGWVRISPVPRTMQEVFEEHDG